VTKTADNARASFIDASQLAKFKSRAMRAGVWFKALPRIDRVLIDLTIKVADIVRSASLAKCVLSVTRKLEGLFESRLARSVREFGFALACKLSLFAQSWGSVVAAEWAGDAGFARFLEVMRFNGHSCATV
jgi:hypothetical protein